MPKAAQEEGKGKKKEKKERKSKGAEEDSFILPSKTKADDINHPSPDQTQKIPQMPQNFQIPPKVQFQGCKFHFEEYAYFCETCDQPICNSCYLIGPHNNRLVHRVGNLMECYMARFNSIHQRANGPLFTKYESLIAQMHKLSSLLQDVKAIGGAIENETSLDFVAMIERLRLAEGQKQAILARDMSVVQKDIEIVNEIINHFNALTNMGKIKPVDFLCQYRYLFAKIEYMIAKPYKITIDIYPNDLPREIKERRDLLNKHEHFQSYIDFRESVLNRLSSQLDLRNSNIENTLAKQFKEEITEWSRLADKCTNQLKAYNLLCYYCGCQMDPDNINEPCLQNQDTEAFKSVEHITSKAPNESFHGTGQHFFAKPDQNTLKKIKEKDLVTNAEKKKRRIINEYKIVFEILIQKIKNKNQEKNLDLPNIFKSYDKIDKGSIPGHHFEKVLNDNYSIIDSEAYQLRMLFDPMNTGNIPYNDFIAMLNDDQYFEKNA